MSILEVNKQLLLRLKAEESQKMTMCCYLTEELQKISAYIDSLESIIVLFEEDKESIQGEVENGRTIS